MNENEMLESIKKCIESFQSQGATCCGPSFNCCGSVPNTETKAESSENKE
jgi:hypothetical protein